MSDIRREIHPGRNYCVCYPKFYKSGVYLLNLYQPSPSCLNPLSTTGIGATTLVLGVAHTEALDGSFGSSSEPEQLPTGSSTSNPLTLMIQTVIRTTVCARQSKFLQLCLTHRSSPLFRRSSHIATEGHGVENLNNLTTQLEPMAHRLLDSGPWKNSGKRTRNRSWL